MDTHKTVTYLLYYHSRYTFKALGAGFYGLRHAKDFRKTITDVIMQAGDADRYVYTYTRSIQEEVPEIRQGLIPRIALCWC